MDCFVAIAPLHKRFAFVAGNDSKYASAFSRHDLPECLAAGHPTSHDERPCFYQIAMIQSYIVFLEVPMKTPSQARSHLALFDLTSVDCPAGPFAPASHSQRHISPT